MKHFLYAVLAAALLAGCSSFDYTKPAIKNKAFTVSVEEGELPANVMGTATYYPSFNACIIILREYPKCLLHEIRHCLEGNWHEGRNSDEDC